MVPVWTLPTLLGMLLMGQAPVADPTLIGRITTTIGCPLEGVMVLATSADGTVERRGTTSADGTFRIVGLPYGYVHVVAELRGFESARGSIQLRGRGGIWDASLPVGQLGASAYHRIVGVVKAADGRIIPDATVSVFRVFGATLIHQLRTDSKGEFAVDLRGGRYMVMASQVGFEAAAAQAYLSGYASERRVNFLLPAARVCGAERPEALQGC